MPKVTIIVPVYNVEAYLKQCVDSLANQTLREIEILLVNDGSTDGSGQICDTYAQTDKRIKVIHKPNGGLSDARNKGLMAATGDYVTFVDSDDWINSDTCAYALNVALTQNADLVFWPRLKEFPDQTVKGDSLFEDGETFEGAGMEWLHRRVCGLYQHELSVPTKTDTINSAWGKLYKREIIVGNKIMFRDTKEIGSEDVLFNFKVFRFLKKAVYIKKYFSHYRKDNPNSLTRNHGSTLFSRYLNLFSAMNDFIEQEKLGPAFSEALRNRVCLSVINVVLSVASPVNKISVFQKIKDLQAVITHPLYRKSIRRFSLSYLPPHWKVFFLFCKTGFASGVYFAGKAMRNLR